MFGAALLFETMRPPTNRLPEQHQTPNPPSGANIITRRSDGIMDVMDLSSGGVIIALQLLCDLMGSLRAST